MAIQATLYNLLFKRTSTFALAVVAGSFFFERTFDITSAMIFETVNKGKLWDDIKGNYEAK